MGDETTSTSLSSPTWKAAFCSGQIRRRGALQMKWFIMTYSGDRLVSEYEEWRDVAEGQAA